MSEIETNSSAKAIIRAVMALSKSLDIPVLAEGSKPRASFPFSIGKAATKRKATSSGVPPAWSRLSAAGN